jgi:hypothetical protein
MNLHTPTRGKPVIAMALYAAACSLPGLAQVAPPTILQIDMAAFVLYREDVSDPVKYATDPNAVGITAFGPIQNFYRAVHLADIVAVNGQQVKGSFAASQVVIALRPDPAPGFEISPFQHPDKEVLREVLCLIGWITAAAQIGVQRIPVVLT